MQRMKGVGISEPGSAAAPCCPNTKAPLPAAVSISVWMAGSIGFPHGAGHLSRHPGHLLPPVLLDVIEGHSCPMAASFTSAITSAQTQPVTPPTGNPFLASVSFAHWHLPPQATGPSDTEKFCG